ncbi:Acetyl xylan esterase (AXE1) [Polystyrenella longa]|uniref:Acetyl xylan esterase (AXE1) n=1 Tax=Polystyrenella longa TaxID=2528007 RepID=A0A518CNM3_9PLAN|nr:acetylxylan esterase [Polystyrenella longa]QDU80831.1 Acetyl xylan esterase (AXE1) [Polystyrenella longa]
MRFWSRSSCVTLLLTVPVCLLFLAMPLQAEPIDTKIYKEGELPADSRLNPLKDLNGHFPFTVPESKKAWEERAADLKRRILVATGMWPMPERTPLNPVIHGKFTREGITIEKVYFESMPGHFVSGLLFRPENAEGKRPGILSPHGHGGRLHEYSEKQVLQMITRGQERFEGSGRFPKIARCVQLARMGCVVFIYDMLGYADSVQISRKLAHGYSEPRPEMENAERWGLFTAQAESRLQSVMGIQSWNSIRALDFLESLPDVDPTRLAVTGGSGGGTQTILLCATDDRPIAAFPQGMVSTSMQGGCTCENCSLLRVGTGNVELAALFAPKPQAMTAANDWTKAMMEDGYPELQKLYSMIGKKEDVFCNFYPNYPHNYNYVTRAVMYSWFNKYLNLGLEEPIVEDDYEVLTKEEHAVWNEEHPAPAGGDEYEVSLTRQMSDRDDALIASLEPTDEKTLAEYQRVVGGAIETIIGRKLPASDEIQRTKVDKQERDGYLLFKDKLTLTSRGEEVPMISFFPKNTEWNGHVVLWVDGAGKSALVNDQQEPTAEVRQLIESGNAVMGVDLLYQGEFLVPGTEFNETPKVESPRAFAGYTFGFNHSVFASRVHDILTVIAFIRGDEHAPESLSLLGTNGAGPLVAAARAIAGDKVNKAAVVSNNFRFTQLPSFRDPQFLPGVVKYGDVPGLLSLSAPYPLWIGGEEAGVPTVVEKSYSAAGAADMVTSSGDSEELIQAAVEWLIAK